MDMPENFGFGRCPLDFTAACVHASREIKLLEKFRVHSSKNQRINLIISTDQNPENIHLFTCLSVNIAVLRACMPITVDLLYMSHPWLKLGSIVKIFKILENVKFDPNECIEHP